MDREREADGRLGILVGGGPAPGINGVIGAAAIEARRNGLDVMGLLDGFKWLVRGDTSHVRPLTADDVAPARFRGGCILRTSRENPTQDEAKLQNVATALRKLGIRYLVTIGGDDTAFSARKTCQAAHGALRVAHVPKTIDNDLNLGGLMPTFGFQTARAVGGALVGNLVEDARTTNRWYVLVAMGRSAGHLALGMGVAGGATLTLIPEEFRETGVSLDSLCAIIEAAMLKAAVQGREYGVVVVAEGLAELMRGELGKHPFVVVEHDPAGHLRLGEVPLALILKRRLQERAAKHGMKRAVVDVTVGYELRCADPIAFDIEYCQQLGFAAVRFLLGRGHGSRRAVGALISIQAGKAVSIPFLKVMDRQTGKTAVRRVDIRSDQYRSARAFMTRLEPEDMEAPAQLAKLAAAARLSPSAFRRRYGRAAAAC